jgi:hypothetical protein
MPMRAKLCSRSPARAWSGVVRDPDRRSTRAPNTLDELALDWTARCSRPAVRRDAEQIAAAQQQWSSHAMPFPVTVAALDRGDRAPAGLR